MSRNLFIKLAAVLGLGVFILALMIAVQRKNERTEMPPTFTPVVATTTEATTTTPVVKKPEVKATPVTQPEKVYIYVPTTQPTVEVVNGNKAEGDINIYEAPAQTQPVQNSEPAFIEPREMTPLEVAVDIAKMYDNNATAEYYGDNKIRVRIYDGKSVTVDIIQGWEENLKLTLRRIK